MLLVLLCSATPVASQIRVPDDSIAAFVAVESELLWRNLSLADALGLRSGVAYPLRLPRIPLQLQVDGWTALAQRPTSGYGDQYAFTVHYQHILADRPHPKSVVFGYVEYWNPNVGQLSPRLASRTRELRASALADVGIPSEGIRTVSLRLDVARDISRENATWIRGAASASIGATVQHGETDYSVSAIPTIAVSMSDLRGPRASGTRPAFGFHSADAELDIELRTRWPTESLHSSTTLQLGSSIRAERLGANIGWVGIRQSFLIL